MISFPSFCSPTRSWKRVKGLVSLMLPLFLLRQSLLLSFSPCFSSSVLCHPGGRGCLLPRSDAISLTSVPSISLPGGVSMTCGGEVFLPFLVGS
ncbi:hypothetical protein GGR58DRAFT_480829 [Xylaria digitata]|nr:hypothetical protein GGR58DRAFT_480829 [Xylaria digitata]